MKRIMLIAFFSLLLFSVAIAAIDTRPGVAIDVSRTGTYKILDVSCFLNDARVGSKIIVTEYDPATGSIVGTGTGIWAGDGRWSFKLTPGKNYRVTGEQSLGMGYVYRPGDPKDSKELPNFEHSTAISLILARTGAGSGR